MLGPALVVCLATSPFASAREEPDAVLARWDFEDDAIETGPYTLWIFEGAKGSVSLSTDFRYQGFRSVEIRDRAGDGEFAELLLNEGGVAVVPGGGFGAPGHIRLSFACSMQTLEKALERMRKVLTTPRVAKTA